MTLTSKALPRRFAFLETWPRPTRRRSLNWKAPRTTGALPPKANFSLYRRAIQGTNGLYRLSNVLESPLHRPFVCLFPFEPFQLRMSMIHQKGIHRPWSGTHDEQIYGSHDHGVVRTEFMKKCPKSDGRRRRRERKWRSSQINGDFRGQNGHDHFEDERDSDETGEETEDEKKPSHNFQPCDEMGHELGRRNPDLGESANSLVGVDEF